MSLVNLWKADTSPNFRVSSQQKVLVKSFKINEKIKYLAQNEVVWKIWLLNFEKTLARTFYQLQILKLGGVYWEYTMGPSIYTAPFSGLGSCTSISEMNT